ncbi:MAG: hypothetical protein FWG90_11495 [Oscillospiraceae bacterium]|nr:hypothetical protein [Oscillospiraceae bacterium]
MMYPYITLEDETLITHSHLIESVNGKSVLVHFERPVEGGFDMARCCLPSYEWVMRDGYSDIEIKNFENIAKSNSHLFFKYAELGGADIAKII